VDPADRLQPGERVSLRSTLAILLAIGVAAPHAAWAKKGAKADSDEAASDEEPVSDEEPASDEEPSDEEPSDETAPKKVKDKTKPKKQDDGAVKQDLSGHDLGTNKKENLFEKDRFFVDKVDTEKTENKTLIQGSLTSSSMLYTESGGTYGTMQGGNAARFARYYTELRLQTDFRHLSGGRWDARIDARARFVPTPPDDPLSADPIHIQSGFNGRNEYDLRELWLFHSGKRSDVFLGRQYVADLGAVKFDGLRVDYAQSRTVTLIGFGGLYPVKGSRSITTDYVPLKDDQLNSAGKLVGAGGFGGAYRTINSYGSIGGVALVPFKGETPRVFATSSGYLRSGSTLDVYHFALIDLASSVGPGLTNLSAGVNYKPGPRLRLTANFNRVDVDTLNVQANAFLNNEEATAPTVIQNETYFRRLATNLARGGVSAGLGPLQRFEVTVQGAYRWRPAVALDDVAGTTYTLDAAKGVDLYGAITDRHSIKNLRLGVDVASSFKVGDVAYQRSEIFAIRGSAGRELQNGHGEWEAEISYATTKDAAKGIICMPNTVTPNTCFGSSTGSILSAGGTLFYRVNRDWMAMGTLFLTRQKLTHYDVDMANPNATKAANDPPVTGALGFVRIAYRF
jgi:hypothetical protein